MSDVQDLLDVAHQLRAVGCVYAEAEAAAIAERFPRPVDRRDAVDRRCAGTPLELILGAADFAGVSVTVQPGVFLPRQRAEALVDVADGLGAAVLHATSDRRDAVIALDLGCGSGALAAALRARHPTWQVHACDLDQTAVECARANGHRFGFAVHRGDWFSGLPSSLEGRLDVVVAHLPYVPTANLPLIPRDYRAVEPRITVDGGPDGLDPWRRVAAACPSWLAPGGSVLTQVAEHQVAAALAVGEAAGLSIRTIEYDDSVVIAGTSAATTSDS